MLGIDLPVELGGVDLLIAEARHQSEVGVEAEIRKCGGAGIAADGDVGAAKEQAAQS